MKFHEGIMNLRFSICRPSAILDLLDVYLDHLDHPRRVFGGLDQAKFGWNWCSSFGNMKVLIFGLYGSKTPINAPNINDTSKGVNGNENSNS